MRTGSYTRFYLLRCIDARTLRFLDLYTSSEIVTLSHLGVGTHPDVHSTSAQMQRTSIPIVLRRVKVWQYLFLGDISCRKFTFIFPVLPFRYPSVFLRFAQQVCFPMKAKNMIIKNENQRGCTPWSTQIHSLSNQAISVISSIQSVLTRQTRSKCIIF